MIGSGCESCTLLPDRLFLTYYPAMRSQVKRMDVEAAKNDLKNRTLAHLGYDFARLIYLSSLRDFSTGEYHHYGLARAFSESAASAAMTDCHEELFHRIALGPLESLVAQIDRFIRSSPKDYEKTLNAWETLGGYHVAVPSVCDQMTADLFRSNVKIAMVLLKSPRSVQQEERQHASPHPSLGQ
jgi:hypothetical protein